MSAENTRTKILQAAFNEMHKHGYQGLRINTALEITGLKKGALYHHFTSKHELGLAVLEELIQNKITEIWITPLAKFDNPIEGIKATFQSVGETWGEKFFLLGCPLNNLAQEMTAIDDDFRNSIEKFMLFWQQELVNVLKRGQDSGLVKMDIELDDTARFIITVIEGAFGQAKISQDKEKFFQCGKQLDRYLDTLAL